LLVHPKFNLEKKAKHTIEYCGGAACRIGGACVGRLLQKIVKAKFSDEEFELIQRPCTGHCGNGAWIKADGLLFVRLEEGNIETIIEKAARGDYGKMFVYEMEHDRA
jgi:NADH:ubiquinone oxidoreductase subunit E